MTDPIHDDAEFVEVLEQVNAGLAELEAAVERRGATHRPTIEMTRDIVERLREMSGGSWSVIDDAADEIERLRAVVLGRDGLLGEVNAELRAARGWSTP